MEINTYDNNYLPISLKIKRKLQVALCIFHVLREMVSGGYVNSETKRVSLCFKGLYHLCFAQTIFVTTLICRVNLIILFFWGYMCYFC